MTPTQRTPEAESAGRQIKQGRRAFDWTQRDLSEKAGVTFTTVSKIESGFPIDDKDLQKIVQVIAEGLNADG